MDRFDGESPLYVANPASMPEHQSGHRLGPLWQWVPLRGRHTGRLIAATVAAAALSILMVAGWLKPDPNGSGTHRQLGLPPCGFQLVTGMPCPTCGMTTAFACTVRGRWIEAIHAQPAGWLLAIGTMAVAVFALATLAYGKRLMVNWYRINPTTLIWLGAMTLVAGWAVKLAVHYSGA